MRVGLVDLEHPHPLRAQIASQPGRVGAGRLDRDQIDLPEVRKPVKELPVAPRGSRKAL